MWGIGQHRNINKALQENIFLINSKPRVRRESSKHTFLLSSSQTELPDQLVACMHVKQIQIIWEETIL